MRADWAASAAVWDDDAPLWPLAATAFSVASVFACVSVSTGPGLAVTVVTIGLSSIGPTRGPSTNFCRSA